jgi:hypothetical protein
MQKPPASLAFGGFRSLQRYPFSAGLSVPPRLYLAAETGRADYIAARRRERLRYHIRTRFACLLMFWLWMSLPPVCRSIAESGQIVEIATPASERLAPPARIARTAAGALRA